MNKKKIRPEFWKMTQSKLLDYQIGLLDSTSSTDEYLLKESKYYIKNIVLAYKRWTEEEEQALKEGFINGRLLGVAHKELWEEIGEKINRPGNEVKRKLIRMYETDEELKEFKKNSWSKEKILEEIKNLYLDNKPINKIQLPKHLSFIIHKVIPPQKRHWFDSYDHALAEGVFQVGYPRLDDGKLDLTEKFNSLEEALSYIRRSHKKRHRWSKSEIKDILEVLHNNDYPLTLRFLANHGDLYKPLLGLNRSIESLKDVIKRVCEEEDVESFQQLVLEVAPEYQEYLTQNGRLKYSTEELRVKKFLDRFGINYIVPRLSDKLPTFMSEIPNVVPDFIILEEEKPVAIVEVFGTISDRVNMDVGKNYNEKTRNKTEFYPQILGVEFIEIYNNKDRCDLSDRELFNRFGKYIKVKRPDLGELICSPQEVEEKIAQQKIAILYDGKKYTLKTSHLDFQFDSLFEIPNRKELREVVEEFLIGTPDRKKEPQKFKHNSPSDYQPFQKAPDYDGNRFIAPDDNEYHRSGH